MGGALKGDTSLKLDDGREYTLVLDMEAMLSVEDAVGKPLPEVMKMARQGFMTAVAAIAQAAFSRHHPGFGRADVLELMRTQGDALEQALGAAVKAAYPDQTAGNAKPAGKPRRGKSSGGSGVKSG